MLHRSFKPAKCKTVLKLASARIKLLKNKKEVVYKQQKKEVAQLLESGQDRTARIRVEHVIREEKTMAAYELIEIYCELIVQRLSMIETQKNCPIDLKEAITSVMFASPRCAADIPELLDIRKHFTAKYGKEFVSAAVELRPNSGVNRLLVEKLSATAPDTQTKIKIMTSIAEEHNIKWDPSVGEKDEKPVDDLLSGPKTFENVNKVYVESPVMQAAPSFQQKQDVPVNHYEQNRNSSLRSENFSSADVGTSKTMPANPHPEPRPSPNSEGRELQQSFSGDRNDFSPSKQNWNMEFKDATSAAQAAAEAAERASMAARAAAELSSRENTKILYSQESQKSSVYGSRDECQPNYAGSTMLSEDPPKKSGNNSFHSRTSERTNERKDEDDEYNLAAETAKLHSRSKKSSCSASVKSSSASMADDLLVKSSQKNDGYSQMSSPKRNNYSDKETVMEKFHEGSQKDADKGSQKEKFHSRTSERTNEHKDEDDEYNLAAETAKLRSRSKKSSHSASVKSSSASIADDLPVKSSQKNDGYSQMSSPRAGIVKPKRIDYSDEETAKGNFHEGSRKDADKTGTVEKQSSSASSRSHSSTSSNHEKFRDDIGHNFFGGVGRGDILKDSEQVQSYDHSDQVFDNYDSDDDKGGFDKDVFNVETDFFPSPERETPTHVSKDAYISNSISTKSYLFKDTDTPEVSISHSKSNVLAEPDELQRVAFDHSNGPSSESEEEVGQPKHNFSPRKQISPRMVTSQLDFDEINRYSVYDKFDEEKSSQSSRHSSVHETMDIVEISETPDEMKDDDFLKLSSFEDNAESSLGVLTGGRRNMPKLLPYNRRHRSSDSSSDSDSDDFVHVPKEPPKLSSKPSVKNQPILDTQQNSTTQGRLTSGGVSRRTRAGIVDKSSYSDQMRAFLEGAGDGSSGSGNTDVQERSKPAQASTKRLNEEKLKTAAFENQRWTEQSNSKPAQEEKLKTSTFGKPRWNEQEERLKTSSLEKPRTREQARPKYEEEVITPAREERLKTSAYEKPRTREQARPKYEEEVITPAREERFKTSAYEKSRTREQARPKYEEEVITPSREERLKTSAYEKPRTREQARPKYVEEVITPACEERLKTSAYEKPRTREHARPKYEEEVITPACEERLKTSAYEKPRTREQARPKYEEEVITPAREERLKTSAYEKPRSREQARSKYEQEVDSPGHGERQKTSSFQASPNYEEEVYSYSPRRTLEKPRSRGQASPKYEQEVNTPARDDRLKASAVEKPNPRSREQARPKYEQEVNTPAPERDDRLKASVVEKPNPRSREQARPKYEQEVHTPSPKREERLKSSSLEKPPSPVPEKTVSLKTSTSGEKIPAREGSFERASHVHPKLPDFDTITAHFLALRSNPK